MSSIKSHLVAAVGAVALLTAPLAALPVLELPEGYVTVAGNGKGGGKGNSGENGGGGGNGGGSSEKSQSRSESGDGSSEKRTSPGQARKAGTVATLKAPDDVVKAKNIKAELAGLNSLKRNINGLMNSSDPRMEAIRTYVLNGAEREMAQRQLDAAQEMLEGAEGTFASLADGAVLTSYDGLYAYDDLTLATLTARLQTLQGVELLPTDANYGALLAEIGALQDLVSSDEASAVVAAQEAVDVASGVVTTETLGTTDADLTAALLLAANKNRVAAAGEGNYVTPEILDWAKQQLGTGEYNGAIDNYLAGL